MATAERKAEKDARKIVLKKNCWIETNFGIFRIQERLIAEAVPIYFSNEELKGYRFRSSSYAGVTYDLERIDIVDNEGSD
jgi:hypothetical protein